MGEQYRPPHEHRCHTAAHSLPRPGALNCAFATPCSVCARSIQLPARAAPSPASALEDATRAARPNRTLSLRCTCPGRGSISAAPFVQVSKARAALCSFGARGWGRGGSAGAHVWQYLGRVCLHSRMLSRRRRRVHPPPVAVHEPSIARYAWPRTRTAARITNGLTSRYLALARAGRDAGRDSRARSRSRRAARLYLNYTCARKNCVCE
eukprot:3336712-Prymnesium_polylepis.1